MLPIVEVLSLLGLGEQWEQQIRDGFGRAAETCQIPDQAEQTKLRQLVQTLGQWPHPADETTTPSRQSTIDLAQSLGLDVRILKSSDQQFLWLCEKEPRRGWGQILWRYPATAQSSAQAIKPLRIVEVPHPVFDTHTPELALQIFEKSHADIFLMAGSHRLNRSQPSPDQPDRGLADAAHSRQTAFHSMHHGLVDGVKGRLQIFQIHGFKSRGPSDPEAVISDGLDDGFWGPSLLQLETRLKQGGIKAQRADFSANWLTARTNVQIQDLDGQSRCVPKGPVEFVHIEFSEAVRALPKKGSEGKFSKAVQAFDL